MSKLFNLDDWYTNDQAVAKLSQTAGRPIDKNYPRTLAKYHLIEVLDLGNRSKLYSKRDIDAYVVRTTPGRRPAAQKQQPLATGK